MRLKKAILMWFTKKELAILAICLLAMVSAIAHLAWKFQGWSAPMAVLIGLACAPGLIGFALLIRIAVEFLSDAICFLFKRHD